jgi:hypothetical protein
MASGRRRERAVHPGSGARVGRQVGYRSGMFVPTASDRAQLLDSGTDGLPHRCLDSATLGIAVAGKDQPSVEAAQCVQ